MQVERKSRDEVQVRFSGSATVEQMEQMHLLMEELRYSRSKIIRLAVALLLEVHQQNPKRYGV